MLLRVLLASLSFPHDPQGILKLSSPVASTNAIITPVAATTTPLHSIAVRINPGEVKLNPDGTGTFQPSCSWYGRINFVLTVTDDEIKSSSSAPITVTINPTLNKPPEAIADCVRKDSKLQRDK